MIVLKQPELTRPFSFAFQPVIDVVDRKVVSYEALVRGLSGESAHQMLTRNSAEELARFDRECRVVAIQTAARLGLTSHLNLNFLPTTIYSSSEVILSTVQAAEKNEIPLDSIVLEISEVELIGDQTGFALLINEYKSLGINISIDDFGKGYSGLSLLADFQPDQIKLDMNLVRRIEARGARQAIVRALAVACGDLGVDIVVEGVETIDEYVWFRDEGFRWFQGYLFARPAFEKFPEVHYPEFEA